jgi:hypothetical protein
MIPLKDTHFNIQMCLSPEKETDLKRVMEARKLSGNGGGAPGQEISYNQVTMSIPEAI